MKTSWRTEWPHWLLLAAMFGLAASNWASAPERIPVHWGLHGQVDRYGGRVEGLLAIPLTALGIYFLFLLLPRIDPKRASYAAFAGPYSAIRLGVLAVLAALYALTWSWIHGRPAAIHVWVPAIVGALFVVIGSVLGRVRPNWFVGVRTPWTLSSRVSWDRTNRAGGRLFLLLGAGLVLFAATQAAWLLWPVIAGGLVGVLGLVVYSYLLWRHDPDRTPPTGTSPGEG
jgi:uncharacterized membrane protein